LFGLVGTTALSLAANQATAIALPWLVLEKTGRALDAGWLAVATGLAVVAGGFAGGALTDRLGSRRTALLADGLSALTNLAIAGLVWAGQASLTLLAILAALGALLDPAGLTARESALPGAARRAGLRLEEANAWGESAQGLAAIMGPALGGVLIATGGAMLAMLASAALLSLTAVAGAFVLDPPPRVRGRERDASWLAGWHALRADRLLWALCLVGTAWVMIQAPVAAVTLPVLFHSAGNPGGLGVLLAALGLGGVAGALWFGRKARPWSRRRALLVAMAAQALGFALLSWFETVWAMWLVAGLTGFAGGPIMPLVNTEFQRRTAPERLGRVLGTSTAIALAAVPLGMPLAAWTAELSGPRTALLAAAAAFGVVIFFAARTRALRELDR
jgi:MFS family permease